MDRHRLDVVSCGKATSRVQKAICSGFFRNAAKKDPTEGYRTLVFLILSFFFLERMLRYFLNRSILKWSQFIHPHLYFIGNLNGSFIMKSFKQRKNICVKSLQLTPSGWLSTHQHFLSSLILQSCPTLRKIKESNRCSTNMPNIKTLGESQEQGRGEINLCYCEADFYDSFNENYERV